MRRYLTSNLSLNTNGSTISNYGFLYPVSMAKARLSETMYFVNDADNSCTVLFSKDWNYIKTLSISQPRDIQIVGSYMYIITYDSYFYKLDFSFNQITSNTISACGRRFTYNPICNCFYVIDDCTKLIYIYGLNLESLGTIALAKAPYSIEFFNGNVYIGTKNGAIMIMTNGVVVKTLTGLCQTAGSSLSSLLIDNEGFMAFGCIEDFTVYFYHSNGTYLNKSFPINGEAHLVEFDDYGRLIVSHVTPAELFIFN